MKCPKCKNFDTKVIDSRLINDNNSIRRRRQCELCNFRFTTFERIEISSLLVVKKDGNREPFNRKKLEEGILIACSKRPITITQIEEIIDKLEQQWVANKKEISSSRIGNEVLKKLKKIDLITYIRFASVYKTFHTIEELKKELDEI